MNWGGFLKEGGGGILDIINHSLTEGLIVTLLMDLDFREYPYGTYSKKEEEEEDEEEDGYGVVSLPFV